MDSPSSSNTSHSISYQKMKQKEVEESQNAKNEISVISCLFGSMRMCYVNSFNKVYK
jgi:hypothetical protein